MSNRWPICVNLVTTTAAAAAFAALLLTVWFSRRIARPIQEVTLAAERIAAGKYGEKVYAAGQGEIDRLARTFNHMSQRLSQQISQLEEDQAQLRAILSGMVEGVGGARRRTAHRLRQRPRQAVAGIPLDQCRRPQAVGRRPAALPARSRATLPLV